MDVKDILKLTPNSYFNAELAHKYGINKSIVLLRLVFLHKQTPRKDGYVWQTTNDWYEKTALTYVQVKKALDELEEEGLIESKYMFIKGTHLRSRHIRFVLDRQEEIESIQEKEQVSEEETQIQKVGIEKEIQKIPVEARQLSNRLFQHMVNNNPTYQHRVKDRDLVSWAKEIDKIHRLDGQEWSEIESILDWCQSNDFWKTNILSGAKFRKQFPRLQLQKGSEKVFLM